MDVRVAGDETELSLRAAEDVAQDIRRVLAGQDRFSLVLTGGGTPRRMYERLAAQPDIPWARVDLFWGDERFVPLDHPDSNCLMARQTLIGPAGIPAGNVRPVPTNRASPEAAAEAYEDILRTYFAGQPAPRFDLLLLGMGEDGHVASLFPGAPGLQEAGRWVIAVNDSPKPPPRRITLTLPAINSARRILFLVAGEKKAAALAEVFRGGGLPAGRVRPASGAVTWWADRGAHPG